MSKRAGTSWVEVAVIVLGSALLLFVVLSEDVPRWVGTVLITAVSVVPLLVPLVFIPWMLMARRQGLAVRSRTPSSVRLTDAAVVVVRGETKRSVPWVQVTRARFARNANWTESTMVEAAIGLLGPDAKERARVPESAQGFELLLRELEERGVTIDYVEVSAPTLD